MSSFRRGAAEAVFDIVSAAMPDVPVVLETGDVFLKPHPPTGEFMLFFRPGPGIPPVLTDYEKAAALVAGVTPTNDFAASLVFANADDAEAVARAMLIALPDLAVGCACLDAGGDAFWVMKTRGRLYVHNPVNFQP